MPRAASAVASPPAAEPEHRAFRPAQQVGHAVQQHRVGLRPVDHRRAEGLGRGAARPLPLHVHRDLQRDRAGRRHQRGAGGGLQHAQRGMAVPDAEIGLAHRLQHVRLARHVMDRRAVAVGEGQVDLRGDVQHARARGQRLGLRPRGVAGGGAGAGDGDAQPAGDAGIGIGHVHRASLPPRWHEADAALGGERVQDRHVVDGDDAEDGLHADIGEVARHQLAHRFPGRGGGGGGAGRLGREGGL